MRVQVDLLGRFQVKVDGRAVSAGDWRRGRSEALVKLLALSPGHCLHREQALEALWPGLSPEAAAGNLRKAVRYARHTLGAHDVKRWQSSRIHGRLLISTG